MAVSSQGGVQRRGGGQMPPNYQPNWNAPAFGMPTVGSPAPGGGNMTPGFRPGGSAEPVQNWWLQDNPNGFPSSAPSGMGGGAAGGMKPPPARMGFGPQKNLNPGQMQGTQPVPGGRTPESPYYRQQGPGSMTPAFRPGGGQQQFTLPQIQGGGGQMQNMAGFNSGQFRPMQVQANPYAQQANYYGQMAFNPQMYGGGQGYGMAGQMQGMNPNQSMQQLQQWRNPFVNNMLGNGGGIGGQMYGGQYYNRPQMPTVPNIPQMPQFQQWGPYQQGMYGTQPTNR